MIIKKYQGIIMALFASLLLAGCGGNPNEKILSQEEFASYFELVDLTADNWEEYFNLVEEEVEETDIFDEPTGATTKYKSIQSKDNIKAIGGGLVLQFSVSYSEQGGYYNPENKKVLGLELESEPDEDLDKTYQRKEDINVFYEREGGISHIIATEGVIPNVSGFVIDNLTRKFSVEISEITCSKAKGKILVGNIPDTAWSSDKDGRCIIVKMKKEQYQFYENGGVKVVSAKGTKERWSDEDLPAMAKWYSLEKVLGLEEN